jgi:hypothetical protein
MAETLRTYDQLLTLLADNETGEISAQDLRDVIHSIHQCWAGMAKRATSDQSVGSGTATKITMNSGREGDAMPDALDLTNDRITIPANGDGIYMIHYGANMKAAAGSQTYELQIFQDGIHLLSDGIDPLGEGTEWQCLNGVMLTFLQEGDQIELYADFGASGGTVGESYLHLKRIN